MDPNDRLYDLLGKINLNLAMIANALNVIAKAAQQQMETTQPPRPRKRE
jgi:hypothetical protein